MVGRKFKGGGGEGADLNYRTGNRAMQMNFNEINRFSMHLKGIYFFFYPPFAFLNMFDFNKIDNSDSENKQIKHLVMGVGEFAP